MTRPDLDQLSINTIRFLAVDAVEAANSGHPGLPMDAAPMGYLIFTRCLRHNPRNPRWFDRDRFVLSAGHGSMLLYALLHLTGYALSLDEIRRFRQLGSITPGHPESHLTPGVEATTGPLGQGFGNAVGMAIAEAHLGARYNRPGHTVIDHHTYVLASDGDLMEGVQYEAASLAGRLGLGKLIVLYDSNRVTLAGSSSLTFTEDVGARYQAMEWHVQQVEDGNDLEALAAAIEQAKRTDDRPSLIIVRTILGYGAPTKQGTFQAHGNPLGPDETLRAKRQLGWPEAPAFYVPDEVRSHLGSAVARGEQLERAWQAKLAAYAREFPGPAEELRRRSTGELPSDWQRGMPEFPADKKGLATRVASEKVMQQLSQSLPELMGGSGDLDNSTMTWLKGQGDFGPPGRAPGDPQGSVGGGWSFAGRNIHFGVREHAMGAAVNGMAYHGGLVPYAATFLVFSDYMRPALRLSALSELGSIWVFTHDSIGLGEDGPTHQPVEHLIALRAIPSLLVIRPADANETRWAWQVALENRHRPTALVLTRQALPTLDRSSFASAEGLRRGGYVLNPSVMHPDLILLASGSEVSLIVAAEQELGRRGIKARLVSLPSWELFEEQPAEYRASVLPDSVPRRLAVEAGRHIGWERWLGREGEMLSVERFGASAPGKDVFEHLGLTSANVLARALALTDKPSGRPPGQK